MAFFWRRVTGTVAVTEDPEGWCLARLVRSRGEGPPRVTLCRRIDRSAGRGAVGRAIREGGARGCRLVGVLAQEHYQLFPLDAPLAPREEWADLVRWRIQDRLEYDVAEAVVDLFDLPPTAAAPGVAKVYVVAAREGLVRACADFLLAMRLGIQAIDIPPLALLNLVLLLPASVAGAGVGVLLGSTQGWMVMIVREGVLYLVRSLPVGPLATEDGARPWEGLAGEVRRTLDYYESLFNASPITRLFYVGPPSQENWDPPSSLARRLEVVTEAFPIHQLLTFDRPVDPGLLSRCLVVLGAGLRRWPESINGQLPSD